MHVKNKNEVLSEAAIYRKPLNVRITELAEKVCHRLQVRKSDLSILDFGCGRGETIIQLQELGWNAYGADINPVYVQNGKPMLRNRGLPADDLLVCIDGAGRTPFPDHSFHFVFSQQVFEHVADLQVVAKELHRLLVRGGLALHVFPARFMFFEPHVRMPFVHWLPKNNARRAAIGCWLRFGFGPRGWKRAADLKTSGLIDLYYNYTVQHTFYRSCRTIRNIFEGNGFDVQWTLPGRMAQWRLAQVPLVCNMMEMISRTVYNVGLLITSR